jgi:hypothetical protein
VRGGEEWRIRGVVELKNRNKCLFLDEIYQSLGSEPVN